MQEIELDTKILNKNLEITRISKQLDNLTSDYVELKEQCREQVPMYMLNTLEECHTYIEENDDYSLRDYNIKLATELRNVIKFLQK